ncbi:hypothetical protein Q7A_1430 [Methylophaga nitratireducenticrescens]|uniref:Membrane protein n=1 Tax=Methylophaga nitratireducenticrescens TaxID=754476 RepID=I1XIP1_METNJ|nr:O-antigen ligase family protein [Methylophaga nitratireducenticrescens]AFI84260.1 hypothetical protein Q7A_1430 [Methylophaga nitratireducenticrescens]
MDNPASRIQHYPLWYLPLAGIFALIYVSLSALSFTWIVLLFLALCFAAGAFWFKDIQNVLFFGFVFTSSISLTKALIVEGGIYTPGLSVTLSDIFLIPLLFLWLFDKKIVHGEKIYWSKLHFLPLIFLLWSWATMAISEDKLAGFFLCISFTKYFVIFVFFADYVKTPRQIRLIFYAFGLAMCVHFMMMFLELMVGNIIDLQGAKTTTTGTSLVFAEAGGVHAFRPSGFMGHPNALADLMVFLLPPMLMMLILGQSKIGNVRWMAILGLFVFGIIALLLTLSRAGWISFTAAVLFMLFIGYKRGVVMRKYINMLFVIGGISIIIAVMVFPTIYLRITESDERSSESRLAMMHQAALIIQRNPVVGVGIGGYNRAARANIPEFFAHLSPWFQDELLKGVVHNKYLLVMAEMGAIGLIIFVLMLWRFIMIVPNDRQWSDPVLFALALGVTASIFGQSIFYLFDHFYADQRITLSYLFFGLLTALLKIKTVQNRDLITTSKNVSH